MRHLSHQLPVTQLFSHTITAAVIQLVLCETAASQLSIIQTVSYPAGQLRQLSTSCWSISNQSMYSQSISCQLDSRLPISEADSCDRMSASHFFCLPASQSVSEVERTSAVGNGLIKYKTGTYVTLLFLKCSNNNKSLCL